MSVVRAPAARADGLTRAQRRATVAAIVSLHAAAAWGLMQVREVRDAVTQAAPIFVQMLAPEPPPAPPLPPPPPPPPPPPRPRPKIVRPAPVIAAAPSPAPAVFETPAPPPEPPAPEPVAPPVAEAPPAPPPPPPPPKNIPPSAVRYLEPPAPVYPRASQRARESGRVVVRVYIDEAGLPRSVLLSRSSGFTRLDDAAVAAVRKARFRPYTENGHPTAGWALIPLAFDLDN